MYILICIINSIYNYLFTVYMEFLFQIIQSIVNFILSVFNTIVVVNDDDTKKGGTMATGGEPVLAYWSPENEADSTPASVKLHLLPSRKVLRYISRSMVDHIQLIWHPLGEYLCVQVKRHKKSKKTYYTNFEIFRMKDVHKEVAVEHFKQDEDVVQFQWEPVGTRFAYIYGNSAQRGNIDMYTMGEDLVGIGQR